MRKKLLLPVALGLVVLGGVVTSAAQGLLTMIPIRVVSMSALYGPTGEVTPFQAIKMTDVTAPGTCILALYHTQTQQIALTTLPARACGLQLEEAQ